MASGDVEISQAPTGAVTSLTAPARGTDGNHVLTSTWKVANWLKDGKNEARATGVDMHLVLGFADKSSFNKGSLTAKWRQGEVLTSRSHNLNSLKLTKRGNYPKTAAGALRWNGGPLDDDNVTATLTRKSFWPYTSRKLTSATMRVRLVNAKGTGPWAEATTKFAKPKAPTISALVQDAETGDVTCTITTDAGKGTAERVRTRYVVEVYDSRTRKTTRAAYTTAALSKRVAAADVRDRMALTYGQYVRVRVRAVAQGYAGDSAETTRTLYVSYPAAATIRRVDYTAGARPTGKATVAVGLGSSAEHPTTGVRLQVLRSTEAKTATAASASSDWQDVAGAVDDGQCVALAAGVADLAPDAGTHTWVRLKVWNQIEALHYRYSNPVRLASLEVKVKTLPAASGASVRMTQPVPHTDGAGAALTLGWEASDACTGTQVAWSDWPSAWGSTTPPSTHDFDGAGTAHNPRKALAVLVGDGGQTKRMTFDRTRTVHVRGLDPGKTYYIRARRYRESGGTTAYGKWTPLGKVTCATPVTSVALEAPASIREGQDVALSWSLADGARQTRWVAQAYDARRSAWVDVAGGSGSVCSARVPWANVKNRRDGVRLRLRVRSTAGGSFVSSPTRTVKVASPPNVGFTFPTRNMASAGGRNRLVRQALQLNVTCSVSSVRLSVVVRAHGCAGDASVGRGAQAAGDVVWSWSGARTLKKSGSKWACDLQAPSGLDLRDGAAYSVYVQATSTESGLASNVASRSFQVIWAHQAPAPNAYNRVKAQVVTLADGSVERRAVIKMYGAMGMWSTDVADVWRVTPDGITLVAEGVPWDAAVLDRWAPYGTGADLAYRVVIRTANGDTTWRDYPYELAGNCLRIDWDGGRRHVELPYNLRIADSYKKDFEARAHLDGTTEGYWDLTTTRTATLSTDLIRVADQSTATALRALAHWAGPCLVRTPDGCCFAANVEVGGMDRSASSAAMAVSIDATEIKMPAAWRAQVVNVRRA